MTRRPRTGGPRGTSSPNSKLTDDDVRAMRVRRAGGASFSQLAHDYGVCSRVVQRICARLSWKHVI